MKLDNVRANWRLWLLGLVIALAGVGIARVAAPYTTGKTQTVLTSLGRLMAFAGLIIIAFGIKKRASDSSNNSSL